MMTSKRSGQVNSYRIRVKENLGLHANDWLAGLTIIHQDNGETLLIGQFADQPALRGLLDQLWDLNLTVLSVEQGEQQGSNC